MQRKRSLLYGAIAFLLWRPVTPL